MKQNQEGKTHIVSYFPKRVRFFGTKQNSDWSQIVTTRLFSRSRSPLVDNPALQLNPEGNEHFRDFSVFSRYFSFVFNENFRI